MQNNLLKLLRISRPVSWPNTAYPFAAAFLVTGGSFNFTFWLATIYFLIPYNLLMYGINDVFDYESDIRNPRKGGLEGAVEQKAFHPTIVAAAVITNAPFIIYLLAVGTLVSNSVFVVLIFFVLAYSVAGLRFKEIPILDSLTSSIHFVGPTVFALAITGFHKIYIPYIVAFFLWGMASHAFGAVQDIIPDREGKLSSVATIFGARITTRIVIVLYTAASVLIIAQSLPALFVGLAGLIYVANVVPYFSISDKTSARVNAGWRRFIWLNLFTGFIITLVLISTFI